MPYIMHIVYYFDCACVNNSLFPKFLQKHTRLGELDICTKLYSNFKKCPGKVRVTTFCRSFNDIGLLPYISFYRTHVFS